MRSRVFSARGDSEVLTNAIRPSDAPSSCFSSFLRSHQSMVSIAQYVARAGILFIPTSFRYYEVAAEGCYSMSYLIQYFNSMILNGTLSRCKAIEDYMLAITQGIAHVEVLAEKFSYVLGGEKGQALCVLFIELAKTLCRLVVLADRRKPTLLVHWGRYSDPDDEKLDLSHYRSFHAQQRRLQLQNAMMGPNGSNGMNGLSGLDSSDRLDGCSGQFEHLPMATASVAGRLLESSAKVVGRRSGLVLDLAAVRGTPLPRATEVGAKANTNDNANANADSSGSMEANVAVNANANASSDTGTDGNGHGSVTESESESQSNQPAANNYLLISAGEDVRGGGDDHDHAFRLLPHTISAGSGSIIGHISGSTSPHSDLTENMIQSTPEQGERGQQSCHTSISSASRNSINFGNSRNSLTMGNSESEVGFSQSALGLDATYGIDTDRTLSESEVLEEWEESSSLSNCPQVHAPQSLSHSSRILPPPLQAIPQNLVRHLPKIKAAHLIYLGEVLYVLRPAIYAWALHRVHTTRHSRGTNGGTSTNTNTNTNTSPGRSTGTHAQSRGSSNNNSQPYFNTPQNASAASAEMMGEDDDSLNSTSSTDDSEGIEIIDPRWVEQANQAYANRGKGNVATHMGVFGTLQDGLSRVRQVFSSAPPALSHRGSSSTSSLMIPAPLSLSRDSGAVNAGAGARSMSSTTNTNTNTAETENGSIGRFGLSYTEIDHLLAVAVSLAVEVLSVQCTSAGLRLAREEAEAAEDDAAANGILGCDDASGSSSRNNGRSSGSYGEGTDGEKQDHVFDSELSRRRLALLYYFIRSPLFNRATLPLLQVASQLLERVPLLNSLPSYALDLLSYLNKTHFYTSASS